MICHTSMKVIYNMSLELEELILLDDAFQAIFDNSNKSMAELVLANRLSKAQSEMLNKFVKNISAMRVGEQTSR